MGVLNVTPDSFSDGGLYLEPTAAVDRALTLASAGADIIDIGGESTRPGSDPVSPSEQMARVVPVIAELRSRSDVPISIDTTSAEVAAAAVDVGASIVNDISAFRFDSAMLELLADRGLPAIAMHTLAPPRIMQQDPTYGDVVAEVLAHLAERLDACERAGVERTQILVDPGIGFGKTLQHNLVLIRHAGEIATLLGRPIVIGTSRKSFLGALTGKPVTDRLGATAASCAAAIARGAHVVRVHDVADLSDTIVVADAIARA